MGAAHDGGAAQAEALDAALCYGWIDSQKQRYDDASWVQKFTPRGPRSVWSKINRDKVAALTAAGRMRPAGLRAVEAARADEAVRCVVLASSHEKVFSSGANLTGFSGDVPLVHRYVGTERFPRLFRLIGELGKPTVHIDDLSERRRQAGDLVGGQQLHGQLRQACAAMRFISGSAASASSRVRQGSSKRPSGPSTTARYG